MKRGSKKGAILAGNIVFIILNLIFLIILIVFLVSRSGSAAVLEERYAKQIALLIDSAEPVMLITLDMGDALKKAERSLGSVDDVVQIRGNIVTVRLRDKGGYSYSFFNDVDANAYPDRDNNEYTGNYIITVNEKGEEDVE